MRGRVLLAGVVLCLLAVVPSADAYIYWSSSGSGSSSVGRADLDGSNVNPALVDNIYYGLYRNEGVAADGTHVYWIRGGNGVNQLATIGRATVDGGNPDHVFQPGGTLCDVSDLAVDAANFYWLKTPCEVSLPEAINRAPTGGLQPFTEPYAGSDICGIAIDDTYLYWSAGQYIGRALLNGGSPEPTWLDTGAGTIPCGVAVNDSHVFWTVDGVGGVPLTGTSIGRATIDGAEASVSNNFITGLGYPTAIAVQGSFIYWTARPDVFEVAGRVGRSNLDGSGVNLSLVANVLNPNAIAVDSAGPGGGDGGDAPIQGKQVSVRPISGTVLIKRPGESAFSELTAGETIPVGSLVDTRDGVVELTVAYKGERKLETAKFKYGLFKITQSTKKGSFTVLKLKGELERCGNHRAAAPRRAKGGRRLWGSGDGHFTSRGHRGSGSARGTTWQVSDRCDDTTLIASIKGKVWARDLTNGKHVVLKTGEQFVAGAKKRK